MMTVFNTVDCLDIHSLLNNGSVSKLQTPFTTQRNRAKSFMENSAMARLRLLRGLGPADPQNKIYSREIHGFLKLRMDSAVHITLAVPIILAG